MSAKYTQIIKDFLELTCDFKGEVLGAELIKNNLPPGNLYFKAVGDFKRPTARDIEAVQWDSKEDEEGNGQIILELNREGIYDMLPEAVFHFKDSKKEKKNKNTVLSNIRQSRTEERQARKFFGPFENEFFQVRLQLELERRALLQPGSTESNLSFFERIFGDAGSLNEHQIFTLLHILPIAYKIRGDLEKIAYCISLVISRKVEIKQCMSPQKETFSGELRRLGEAKLGIDAIVGNSFQSPDIYYDICIKNVERKNLTSFFDGGSDFSVIQFVSNFLFPFNSIYQIIPEVQEEEKPAFLAGKKNESYLGFNSYI